MCPAVPQSTESFRVRVTRMSCFCDFYVVGCGNKFVTCLLDSRLQHLCTPTSFQGFYFYFSHIIIKNWRHLKWKHIYANSCSLVWLATWRSIRLKRWRQWWATSLRFGVKMGWLRLLGCARPVTVAPVSTVPLGDLILGPCGNSRLAVAAGGLCVRLKWPVLPLTFLREDHPPWLPVTTDQHCAITNTTFAIV